MQKYGADAVRWYLIAQSPPWRTTLFDEEGIGEVQRKFFSTLLNTYSFFALYAKITALQGMNRFFSCRNGRKSTAGYFRLSIH
jgi:isoleucyl-tRNA synthetase